MSARIDVQSGISVGTSYWIERPVLRVGSDPEMDLCLLSTVIDPHALTLEFRQGSYRVHNRGKSPIRMGRDAVQPGQTEQWRAGHPLDLVGQTRLVLQIDGDPRPAPIPKTDVNDDFDVAHTAPVSIQATGNGKSVAEQRKFSTAMQLAVTGICVVIGLFMLLGGDVKTASTAPPPNFAALIQSAMKSESTAPLLVRRLQYAQTAIVRGDKAAARQRFNELRDDLLKQKDRFLAENKQNELEVLDFVEYRLGQLR